MATTAPPPRLFVIVATDADVAVIFRKGPASWYHLVRWDTRNDSFEHGAWFKGRIYPEKCDLSPHGRLLLYFVQHGSRTGTSYSSAYTAVSRVPWMEALVLWPEGNTWGGGGRFLSSAHVALRSGCVVTVHPRHRDPGIKWSRVDCDWHRPGAEVPGAEWSGRDRQGRIIFTRSGRLFRRSGNADQQVLDLRGWRPDPQPAPESARGPLQRYGKRGDL